MIKLFEMFAGYGGASFALKKADIDFQCVGYSEIDKFAIQCYEQNHEVFPKHILPSYELQIKNNRFYPINYGDATKIDPNELPDFDLLTGGFPCQAFSVAGKNKGELDPRGTLFYDIIRIAEVKQPKFMLLENVKGLTNKRHKATFEKILSELDRIGYWVYWQVLNSKEYGIPQNRERVFFICVKKSTDNHKHFVRFKLPERERLKIFLKDILEEEVEEKYYLDDKRVNQLIKNVKEKGKWNTNPSGNGMSGNINKDNIAKTITSSDWKDAQKIIQIGMIKQKCKKRVHETPKEINQFLRLNKGLFTISEIASRLNIPKTQVEHYFRTDSSRAIPSPDIWKKLKSLLLFDDDYDKQVTEIYEKEIEFESSRRVYSDDGCSPTISSTNADKIIQLNNPTHSNNRIYSEEGISPSLNTMQGGDRQPFISNEFRVRKLTPKECFRLMGFLDDEINLEGLSNTQRYKLAGNGWDINLVSKIFKQMFAFGSKT